MISIDKAKEIALDKIQALSKFSNIELAIMQEATVEFEYGWMFFYQSAEYVRTGDENELVGGNAPLIVDKYTSIVHTTGTRHGEEFYIKKYCELRDTPEKFKEEINT